MKRCLSVVHTLVGDIPIVRDPVPTMESGPLISKTKSNPEPETGSALLGSTLVWATRNASASAPIQSDGN
jgi:hypothetical protein